MARVRRGIEVDVPVVVAYEQWARFEDFPQFMDGIDRVVQEDDRTLRWFATVGGVHRDWRTEIVDQTPNVRIAWRSTEGSPSSGAVLFTPLGPSRAWVDLTIEAQPADPVDVVGSALGQLQRRIEADLERFKTCVEQPRVASGA